MSVRQPTPELQHAWLGEAVPLCASESLTERTIALCHVRYARWATCLFCIVKIRA